MANITRYDPFDDLEDLFKGFLVRPLSREAAQQQLPGVKLDVAESEKEYLVEAEIPGVKKEDLQVSINGNQVTIGAEVKKEKEAKENGHKTLRSERYYGKVYRSFTLAQEVDEASAQAKYENGVLHLTLPKKASATAKKLTIQ